MGRVAFREGYEPPVFRKVAYGTWRTAEDPTVYALLELDMSKALAFAERHAAEHGVKITPTHLVARGLTRCLQMRPEMNGMLRRGKISLREHVAMFFQVNVPGAGSSSEDKIAKASLSGTTLEKMETMSLVDIAKGLQRAAHSVREQKDPSFKQTFNLIRALPWWSVRYFLKFSMWLVYELNLDLSKYGLPRDPFGSAMITNVGAMGIDTAWAPLCPYTRVPLLLTLGAIRERAVVENGQVVVRPIMAVGVTLDHRLVDGVHAAHMSREFKKYFADPETYLS